MNWNDKKVLIIGAGGIGSHVAFEVGNLIELGQINPYIDFTLADDDRVELEQIRYQNFLADEVGMNKAEAITNRCFLKHSTERITSERQLKPYDIIIMCVDNNPTRELVINHIHKYDKHLIDLRAEGRNIFALAVLHNGTEKDLEEHLATLDLKDNASGSCQTDLDKNEIHMGNRIVAYIGTQMLLNYLRGHTQQEKILLRI